MYEIKHEKEVNLEMDGMSDNMDYEEQPASSQVKKRHQTMPKAYFQTKHRRVSNNPLNITYDDDDEDEEIPEMYETNIEIDRTAVQRNITLDLNEFIAFKNEIKREIKGLRKTVQRLDEKITFLLSPQTAKTNNLSNIKTKLHLEEPIKDLDAFHLFDNRVKCEKEYGNYLRELLALQTKRKTLVEAIGGVWNLLMAHDLQLKFSGCGKPNKGVAKENLSATHIYLELREYLLRQFPLETDATILSKTSRWLSAAKDRCGGRNYRLKKEVSC